MATIEKPADLHAISDAQAEALCAQLRGRLIELVSRTGGHLASNLGAVELTVALHRVFAPEKDRILFDVGHQCYCHKILTGRDAAMDTLRTLHGVSGFPKPAESACDPFIVGHASTAVSTAVGMARARTLRHESYRVVAVLGDGALSGGLSYEGLSDAGNSGEPLLVILNDNGMSITQSVGGVAEHLARQRLKPQYLSFKKGYRRVMKATSLGRSVYKVTHKIKTAIKETLLPCSLFEDMGFTYLGPVDGHDVRGLTKLLKYARDLEGPVMLHIRTVKGKGYLPAERDPGAFHGVGKFCVATGEPVAPPADDFSKLFGAALCRIARRESRVCAVTAAMQPGTGLDGFAREFPERFFDVGIAEGHAVTMCAGMAKQGMIPVFAVYSSFLQRAYDMLIHDVAIQNLHVVFCVDRAGLVGADGETHQGLFDPAFLDTVPGMTVFCPANYAELGAMLSRAVLECKGPVAVRYPRGAEGEFQLDSGTAGSVVLRAGTDLTLAGYGIQVNALLDCAKRVAVRGVEAEVVKLNVITPLDPEAVLTSLRKTGRLLVAEECAAANCVGTRLAAAAACAGLAPRSVTLANLGPGVIPQGSVAELRRLWGLDGESLAKKVLEVMDGGQKTVGRTAF